MVLTPATYPAGLSYYRQNSALQLSFSGVFFQMPPESSKRECRTVLYTTTNAKSSREYDLAAISVLVKLTDSKLVFCLCTHDYPNYVI